jgi:hypothetical protein
MFKTVTALAAIGAHNLRTAAPLDGTALAIGTHNLTTAAPLGTTDDSFKINFQIDAYPGVKLGDGNFDYHIPDGQAGSGCGTDKHKCACNNKPLGGFEQMQGQGSSLTSTGLSFGCSFMVDDKNYCELFIDIPFIHDNKLTFKCPGYMLYGGEIPARGHDFSRNLLVRKID